MASAFTASFGYLVVVKIVKLWYKPGEFTGWKRVIGYIGGVVGSLFMAFSLTNWSNSVETEVYGLSMMLLTIIFWLSLQYYENNGTTKGMRLAVLISFLAMLGVGIHLTTFLIMPVAAIFLILKKDAPRRAWFAICTLIAAELLAIIAFSDIPFGFEYFVFVSVILMAVTGWLVYQHINWSVLIAIVAFSLIMIGFYQFIYAVIGGLVVLVIIALAARKKFDWKTGMAILLLAAIGFSFHLFIPIRSSLNPRIDENNPSRDFDTFVNYLDRKQYGSELMAERMFNRRGTWAHQMGRHAHMGFWSYFEEQYGFNKIFGLLFILGLFGTWFAIKKKIEIGYPFLIFLLLSSIGLVLYMNFADGVKFNLQTGDAYLEVRNRDYFFTPAFIYFGLAMGLGISALMEVVRKKLSETNLKQYQKPALLVMSLTVLLPMVTLSHNYYYCDRSNHYYPYVYAHNILESCEENAILFTAGDNDTFPLWCLQEVYNVRRDIRVVNLSLINTDWYIWQMKNQYDVPIPLTKEQILWYPLETGGEIFPRPKEPFKDRARKRMTYLLPMPFEGRTVKLQDMMVDEIILENNWKVPIMFSSEPYAESPLNLRSLAYAKGVLYQMSKNPPERLIDADEGFRLFKEVYRFDGLNDPTIFRDDNATGVMLTLGFNAIRIYQEFMRQDRIDDAIEVLEFTVEKYPEFFQSYPLLSDRYLQNGDSAKAQELLVQMETTMTELYERNPNNQFYAQDLGLAKHNLGKSDEALELLWAGFEINPSSGYAYRKLIQYLFDVQRMTDINRATDMFADYKRNLNDPLVQEIIRARAKNLPVEP